MLSNYSFRTKILSFLLPLCIALLVSSSVIIWDNYRTWKESEQLATSANFNVAVSSLIHETQKERARSAQFLNGKITSADLTVQRTEADRAREKVENELKLLDPATVAGTKAALGEISGIRTFVDGKGQASAAIEKFGALVTSLINLQVARAQRFPFKGFESKLASESILEAGKESMGKLRAAVSGILTKDEAITIAELSAIETFMAGVSVNMQSPGLFVSHETKQSIEALLASNEWQQVKSINEKIKVRWSEGRFGADSAEYFKTINGVIDQSFSIINRESESIKKEVKILRDSTTLTLWFEVGCLLIGLTFVLGLSYKIVSEIIADLGKLTERLSGGASATSNAATELSGASTELSSGATEQAAALQETVASLEEIKAMVGRNADNASNAQSIAANGVERGIAGREAVKDMMGAISEIEQTTEAFDRQTKVTNRQLSEITAVITEISGKTKVINDIVFQTKLLSFNASVEAARAGEHGKGFAVVAHEVGNLAQMSGNAAREISGLLDQSASRVEAIINETKATVDNLILASRSKVQTGTLKAQRCNEVLTIILTEVDQISQAVNDIATACREQAQGVDEISIAMSQFEQVNQNTTAATHNLNIVTTSLGEQAQDLHRSVSDLVSLMRGKSHVAEVQQAPAKPGKVIRLPNRADPQKIAS